MSDAREECIDQLARYRQRVYDLMQKSDDMNRIEMLGVRFENACRITNEFFKAEETAKIKKKLDALETKGV